MYLVVTVQYSDRPARSNPLMEVDVRNTAGVGVTTYSGNIDHVRSARDTNRITTVVASPFTLVLPAYKADLNSYRESF